MPTFFLKYTLSNGFVHNWLVVGPQSRLLDSHENEADLIRRYYEVDSGAAAEVVDVGPLGEMTRFEPGLVWKYHRCREDHFVDFSTNHARPAYQRAWAYTQLHLPEEKEVSLALTTCGPADVWVNGEHVQRVDRFDRRVPATAVFPIRLRAGENILLVRFESIAVRQTAFVMAAQIRGLAGLAVEVVLPTNIEAEFFPQRIMLEKLVDDIFTTRYVFGYLEGDQYNQNEMLPMFVDEGATETGEITFRLQSLAGDIFQEGTNTMGASSRVEMAKRYPLRNGPHQLALVPPAHLYYQKNLRFERKEPFFIVRTPFSRIVPPTLNKRRKEALADAAERRNDSLYCEIARIAMGQWENLDPKNINSAVERIRRRQDGSIFDVLGFLGLIARFGKKVFVRPYLPMIQESLAGYRYSAEEAGSDGMDFTSEHRQIVQLACELLAGQLLPQERFGASGQTGSWHRARAEQAVLEWIRQRGMYGFREWDSPASLEAVLAALSHLVDMCDSDQVCELASVLMDKIFFSMAVNSYWGMYGSARGCGDTGSSLSARLEATSGISRLLWMLGNHTEAVMGAVSMACCKSYQLPDLIYRIAQETSTIWGREQHSQPGETPWAVNKVTYRTLDYILSSAQDYYPGTPGRSEVIWQATLGPDARVFVNHPTNLSTDDGAVPNLWTGNGVLPRVAQWGDVLVAVHHLPEDDWLGYTHAYFPSQVFDEYWLQDGWAFARMGDAYIALWASNGIDFIRTGSTALRELRSYGKQNTWICHMGQSILDESFAKFQEKILAMPLERAGRRVTLQTLRKDQISFGWQGPLTVNGEEQPLAGFRHFENPFCAVELPAAQMDILYQTKGIRLKFA